MFEHRQQSLPDFAPPLRDDIPVRGDVDEPETSRLSLLSALVGPSALRRALSIVPVAIIGYAIAWFLYFEPSQNVTAKPVLEAKPAMIQAAVPSEPARQEVVETKPTPAPAPAPAATAPVAPSPPPVTVAAAPSRSLSRDEIKELQGKLDAAGFTPGPIDGVVGPLTEAALRRYAESRRLAKPELTQETLLRLRSETQASQ